VQISAVSFRYRLRTPSIVFSLPFVHPTGNCWEGAVRNNNPISIANGRTTDALSIFQAGAGALKVAVTSNTINYASTQRAILLQGGQDGNGSIDATLTGHTIDMQLDGAGNGLLTSWRRRTLRGLAIQHRSAWISAALALCETRSRTRSEGSWLVVISACGNGTMELCAFPDTVAQQPTRQPL
jgi:hypothetical protein